MRYLLVVPRIVNNIGDWYWFPTGISYIAASLKTAGFDVKILNLNHTEGNLCDIIRQSVDRYGADALLTGGLTGQYGAIRAVIESAKKIKKGIVTIVGGGIITSAPEHAMRALEYVDYGVIGEGEIISCELCAALEKGSGIHGIPGIIYKNHGRYVITEGAPSVINLDKLPFPDYRGVGLNNLLNMAPNCVGMGGERVIPITTSRSCPFHCTFCFHPSGQTYRQRSLDSVFLEIELLKDEFNVKYISIQDELFGFNRERVTEFCQRIKKYNIKWWAQFRVTDVSKSIVAMLKDANCATIALGIESADNSILKSMNKKITIEKSEKALKLIYDSGIGIQGNLIFGDRAETIETAKKTLDWWKKNIHYQLYLAMIVAYPGTRLYDHAVCRGIIPDPVKFIRRSCPVVKLSQMTDSEYSWLVGQILSLPRELKEIPGDYNVVEINWKNARMTLDGACVSCGRQNIWQDVRLFMTGSLMCRKCAGRHTVPIPEEVVMKVAEKLEVLIQKYGEVVFWGIHSYFYAFAKRLAGKVSGELTENIHYVDESEVRHGVEIFGRKIESPEIINQNKINCIVISVAQYSASLKKTIRDAFADVDIILSISDLPLFEDALN
ncbi:(Dimethylallyl)adenosine tRNA methylthiotransferase MiaB [Candidatus Desulfarcum epimagneticum]|uniref:(Dimethylallyl)adenosine tRNA methylthiotransferase MiaB n=1 Tax=uncultured Desulfobacteraceae bacterium TaxID=218296 RepID=A0A484HFD5_9BACT|nr:(Dimethylallyl)adenosine tRNA methylthiotransferase MiaB [uncultured Desulfobacteraceae bacterium]